MKKALVRGMKQGAAKKTSKTLVSAVKKALGENYPKFFETPLGVAIEPFVIPIVLSLLIDKFAEHKTDHGDWDGFIDDRLDKIYEAAQLALTAVAADQMETFLNLLDPNIDKLIEKL